MATISWTVERVHSLSDEEIAELAEILVDCVDGDASVSFMHPLSTERAQTFWRGVAAHIAAGKRALLVARDAAGICGTAQVVLEQPENQPHRADVSKMLVHRRARRSGCGAALLHAVENVARTEHRSLLVLDTQSGSAASALYERAGWIRAGEIPGYALAPRGELMATSIYYRSLQP